MPFGDWYGDIEIRIGATGDPPLFWDIDGIYVGEAKLHSAGILQGGMESGATSVGFNIQLPSGEIYLVQTSASMVLVLANAVKGAVERFGK